MPGRLPLPGESRATANRLAATDKLVADKQWSEAIDEYLHILEESSDDLIPLDSAHYLCARRLCHQRLAALPPEALRLYRDRVESQAKKWFEQGKNEREPRLLRRLVDEAFCSRYTDRALDLLGDLAFERGRFEEAEFWWRMIALPASRVALAPGGVENKSHIVELLYPDPQVDVARVRAKQLLVRLFAGKLDHWADDLKAFRRLHENDQGELAGQSGKYAVILEAIAQQQPLQKAIEDRRNRPLSWPTFGGDPSRTFIAPQTPRRLEYDRSPDSPWPIRLADQPAGMEGLAAARRAKSLAAAPVQPAFFPIIAGDWVIVAGPQSVMAYDLRTARRVGHFDLQNLRKAIDIGNRPILALDAGYTVTAVEMSSGAPSRVYARLGTAGNMSTETQEGRGNSFLICLDLQPQGDGQFHLCWHHAASATDEPVAYWEGAPVALDEQVFIARTRVDKNPGTTSVDCYDSDSGDLRWRRDICVPAPSEPVPLGSGTGRPRRNLLTLAGSNLVYAPDAGVIVALEAATGRRAWAFRYPSRGLKTDNGDPSPRGLNPVVYDSGRVFASPVDFDGILCLDARSGEKLWERKGIEAVHMLGTAKGKLLLTTAKTESWPAGIRALEAESGADVRRWIQPGDASSLHSYGRGLLAGEWVFWPIIRNTDDGPQKEILVLNQEDGQPAINAPSFWQVHAGNMAFGNGCLAVADNENLYVIHCACPVARVIRVVR